MSAKILPIGTSVRQSVSREEWQARIDLAACYRLMSHAGVQDLTYNHLSARVPGEPQHLLIKSGTMMFDEVTASNLHKYDFDGNPLQDGPRLRGGGLVIHAGILKARSDVHVVFHTHTPANMGVSSQKDGLLMINQHALRFYKRVAYHTFGGFEFNMSQRDPLLESLGDKRIAMLRNHGSLVCGRNIPEAFVDHHYLEMACKGQIAALSGNREVTLIPDDVCAYAVTQIVPEKPEDAGAKDWDACIRLAHRLDAAFAE
ncbi:MAG: class II aldolase/adducin family protein [Burkholderiales bacterium]